MSALPEVQGCSCGHPWRDHSAEPALDGRTGCRRAWGIARCGCLEVEDPETTAENKERAAELNALAGEVQFLGIRISEIERDALDRDLVWPTAWVERTDALAREIRAKALSLYCEHADATGLEGDDLWECDNCGREFIGAKAWGVKAGAR